jgi:hypothetical protein
MRAASDGLKYVRGYFYVHVCRLGYVCRSMYQQIICAYKCCIVDIVVCVRVSISVSLHMNV